MKAEQLRKSILQLAIQGKLVPQDPNDEPASVLLERIRAEKQRLIKEGKMKKDKGDSIIFKGDDNCHYEKIGSEVKNIDDEIPFEIPDTWCWVRLGYLIKIISGVSYDKKDVGRGPIRILRGGNINALKVFTQPDDVFLPMQYFDEEKQIKKDDILIVASTGSKTVIGKAGYIDEDWDNTQIGAFLRIVRSLFYETTNYVKFIFATEYYRDHIRTLAQGTNINNVKAEYIQNLIIPVPPVKEQKRIIEEIKRFEPLLIEYDRLEQQATKLDVEIYDKLKKSILQYTIQGKLVEQDETDEPASVLLERIRTEKKAQLGKKYVESYIYKGDDNCYYEHIGGKDVNITEEIPFDLPNGWKWTRWGELSESIQYGFNAPAKEQGRIKMVRISDIHNNDVLWDNVPYCDITEQEIPTYLLKANDILFARTGGTVGKSYLVTTVPEDAIYAGYLIRTRYSKELSPQYLKYFMESNLYWEQLREGTIATAQPNCNGKTLSKMLLPLPPIAEQKRIVDKINEICAKL